MSWLKSRQGHKGVEAPKGAALLRHLDTEKLRTLLKRNYLQGPGQQGEELLAAQTTLEQAKSSNQRMQAEGAARSKALPIVEGKCRRTRGPVTWAKMAVAILADVS